MKNLLSLNSALSTQHSKLLTQHSHLAKEALRWAVMRLQQARIESASLDARVLLEHVLGVTREQLLFSLDLPITSEQYAHLEMLVEKRAQRQPIAQLVGRREFWGLDFVVSGYTLDPRPDSETLIEHVLEHIQNRAAALRVLDLGTGTGCLLLSLLSELPMASGLGVDYCDNAILVAKENAIALGISGRALFMRSDWCAEVSGEFDVILANPPYIQTKVVPTLAPEVSEFEPMLALDGGEDGFDCYKKIIKDLTKVMAKNAFVAFELGVGQQRGLQEIAAVYGFKTIGVRHDLGGIARCVILQRES